jgi:hypothetical protein
LKTEYKVGDVTSVDNVSEAAVMQKVYAGSWNRVRISFEMEMVSRAAGIPIRVRMKGNEWYAPGFGVVKTESFNKNGKLAGTSEITSIKSQ